MKNLATMALGFGIGAVCTFTAWCLGCFQGAELMINGSESAKAEAEKVVGQAERNFYSTVH